MASAEIISTLRHIHTDIEPSLDLIGDIDMSLDRRHYCVCCCFAFKTTTTTKQLVAKGNRSQDKKAN